MDLKNWYSEDVEYRPPSSNRYHPPKSRTPSTSSKELDKIDSDDSDSAANYNHSPEINRANKNELMDDNVNNSSMEYNDEDADAEVLKFIRGNPTIKYPIKYREANAVRKTFRCWHCPTIKYDLAAIKEHEMGHLKKFAYKCLKCTFSSDRQHAFTAHVKCHSRKYFEQNHRNKTTSKNQNIISSRKIKREPSSPKKSEVQRHSNDTIPKPKHAKAKSKKYNLKCTEPNCPAEVYESYGGLHKHLRKHRERNQFTCNLCSYSVETMGSLRLHTLKHKLTTSRTQHSFKPKINTNIMKINRGRSIARVQRGTNQSPQIVHNPNGKGFLCSSPNCPCVFHNTRDMLQHMKRHDVNNAGSHKCNQCTYTTNLKNLLKRHLALHLKNGKQAQLKKHQKATATNRTVRIKASSNKVYLRRKVSGPRYGCKVSDCPLMFYKKSSLANHTKLHEGNGAFKCRTCSYSTNKRGCLTLHESKHNKSTTADSNSTMNLITHIKREGVKFNKSLKQEGTSKPPRKHCCEVKACPQMFHCPSEVRKHLRCHEANEKYKCEYCSYSTSTIGPMILHKLKHAKSTSTNGPTNKKTFTSKGKSSTIYRPGWLTRRKQKKNSLTKLTRRYDLVKAGLLTKSQLRVIKDGNPKFTYNAKVTYRSGRTVSAGYRCYHCPKAFCSYESYLGHQSSTHKGLQTPKTSLQFQCRRCAFKANQRLEFLTHCRQHTKTISLSVVIQKLPDNLNFRFQSDFESPDNFDQMPVLNEEVTGEEEGEDTGRIEIEETKEDESSPPYLISLIELQNFMSFESYNFYPSSNLCGLQGGSHVGKTSMILACLVGLAYDLMLDLPDTCAICGIPLDSVLRHGETHGSVELTLEISSYPVLVEKYGSRLKLKRYIFNGLPLSESEFELSYANVKKERGTIDDVKFIINNLIPTSLLRLMVLSPENLKYFLENIRACDEIFSKIVKIAQHKLMSEVEKSKIQLEGFKADLESRKYRILFLRRKLEQSSRSLPQLQFLHELQIKELEHAEEIYEGLENTFNSLVEDDEILTNQQFDHVGKLFNRMRKPFMDFIHTQNYVGDLILIPSGEIIIWIEDASSTKMQLEHVTIEEARRIWGSMTMKRRQLAIIGLFLAFWEIMNICPVMMADSFSSTECEFRLPLSSFSALVGIVRKDTSNRQFILSIPENSPEEFVDKYS